MQFICLQRDFEKKKRRRKKKAPTPDQEPKAQILAEKHLQISLPACPVFFLLL